MKKWIIGLVVLAAAVALATGGDPLVSSYTSSTSGSVPTATSSGLQLNALNGWSMTVCAPTGSTLAGDAGTMRAYVIGRESGSVIRNPDLDQTINVTSTSCGGSQCQCERWPDIQQVQQAGGTLVMIPDTVLVTGADGGPFNDGGASLTIGLTGWRVAR